MQLVAALVLLALGVVIVILGWWGAAHTNIFTEQIPYLISGGLLGLGLIIVSGFMAYAATNERSIRELRRDVVAAIDAVRASEGGPAPASDGRRADAPRAVLVVRAGRSYHVPGCPIVEGKDAVRELSLRDATGEGFAACKLCGPD